jgi:lipoate-protein ligase A
MILWNDGAHDAAENMRRDARLLERLGGDEFGAHEPVLRLFRFAPPGITLGRSQRPERVLDLEACGRDGVSWAVRPTGGRAIFHDQEWTFSLAARLDDPDWGGSLVQAFARISDVIAASLARLGVPVSHATGETRVRSARATSNAACFATSAGHEILVEGRKLVGIAQRRTQAALLHQGSVLLGPGQRRLARYLARGDAEEVLRALETSAGDAGAWLGLDPPIERWAESLAASLGTSVRPLDAAPGAFLLTPSEAHSYTSAASN